MAGHSIINYKGVDISYLDYRGLTTKEMIDAIDVAVKQTLSNNKSIPLLTNIKDAYAVPEFMQKAKKAGKEIKHLTPKSAIVGVNGAKKILVNTYNIFTKSDTKVFDDEESAKEWLIK